MSLDPTPLLDAARRGQPWHRSKDCTGCDAVHRDVSVCVSAGDVARRLDVSKDAVEKWRSGVNRINEENAERYAMAIGLLDIEVWPELLHAVFEQRCRCGERFVSLFAPRLACSERCIRNERKARARARRQIGAAA